MRRTADDTSIEPRTRSVYDELRERIMAGEFSPSAPLKPQELATAMGVSLSVVREALQQLMGEGLADRQPNRGFTVPPFSDVRWQQIAETRRILEVNALRLSVQRGNLEWETRVRATFHRLRRTPVRGGDLTGVSPAWAMAHYEFHRALLDGCGNPVLLETFDRLWTASELARVWSGSRGPARDHVSEHRRLEEAALAGDVELAATLLDQHIATTVAALSPGLRPAQRHVV